MKQQLAKLLRDAGYDVIDFGNKLCDTNDDYPYFAIPLARAVARWSAVFWSVVAE